MKKLKGFLLICCLASASLQANDAQGVSSKGAEKHKYKDTTVLDFSETSVDGQFLRPDAQAVKGEKNIFFDSMLDPRSNFNKELKRSSGAIR